MKKLVLALAATAAFSSAAFAAGNEVSFGEVPFFGAITESKCSLKPVEPISLGQPNIGVFTAPDSASSMSPLHYIEFEDCVTEDGFTHVTIDVLPSGETSLWPNAGSATGVGVEFFVNGKSIEASTGEAGLKAAIYESTASFPINGRIKRLGSETVGAGDVNAQVKFAAKYD